jgi:hypothetical protein
LKTAESYTSHKNTLTIFSSHQTRQTSAFS